MRQGVFIEKCRSIFEDNNGVRYIPRQKFGSGIDIQRVAIADAGETRIFVKPEKRQYKDYKICFVMDCSGSMGGERIDILIQTVHAMAYALTVAGASVFGISFNQKIEEVKTKDIFDLEALSKTLKERLDTYGGCNRDGAAVQRASRMLLRLPASPAKIVIIFSDGSPACGHKYHEDKIEHEIGEYSFLRRQIKHARGSGLELLSVDIQSGSCEAFYGKAKTVYIKRISDLYKKTMSLLERNIRRG